MLCKNIVRLGAALDLQCHLNNPGIVIWLTLEIVQLEMLVQNLLILGLNLIPHPQKLIELSSASKSATGAYNDFTYSDVVYACVIGLCVWRLWCELYSVAISDVEVYVIALFQ